MTYYVKLSNGYSFYISGETYDILCNAIEHQVSFIVLTMKYDKFLNKSNRAILININQITFVERSDYI